MDENKFKIQQKKLEITADKSDKELANEEFNSNLETATRRLDALEAHILKIQKGQEILEAQFDKAWQEYNGIRDVNLVNMENLRKQHGLELVEQIKLESGAVSNADFYQNAAT